MVYGFVYSKTQKCIKFSFVRKGVQPHHVFKHNIYFYKLEKEIENVEAGIEKGNNVFT